MNRLWAFGLCGILFVTIGTLAPRVDAATARKGAAMHRQTPPRDRISADSARTVALARVPGARVKSRELEREAGRWIYSFDLSVPGKTGVEEVQVDARTAEVVSVKHETAKNEKREQAGERKSTGGTPH